ncbi:hypothetical protein APZ41_021280 [Roseomonas mucosa]|uniref:Uncharacterized protein n=1 Tax=Roseomonas mucosa TaxID=207340 RepID=A0A1S8D0R5_9PROT|nr:SIR2 family protein [Roseomonas mucosa]ONH81178.1 hypothetical protein APZ41_021280 [Roseomonas mucosa]
MQKFNENLLEDLSRQRVVLFLGAGVSSSAVTLAGGRIKGWHKFLDSMRAHVDARIAKQISGLLRKSDYLLACEILQSTLREDWQKYVNAEFGQMAKPSSLHQAIIALDQRIILTTNFDKLIENCWGSSLGESVHLPTVVTSIKNDAFRLFKDHSGKYLVKIHGTVDAPETLIFSRSEYIKLAFGNTLYSTFIENLLLNYTFIFIGFSMDDPAILSLMEMYALRYKDARPHYMFSGGNIPENIRGINLNLRKLNVLAYNAKNNHEELPRILLDLSEQMRRKKREIFANWINEQDSMPLNRMADSG